MTGMKEGAGEDPFADDEKSDSSAQNDTERTGTTDGNAGVSRENTSTNPSQQHPEIPYKLRRDSVQDGRDRVPLFLKSETKQMERTTQRELEEQFGENVALTDLREALMKIGLQHVDDVKIQLEEWGYGMTFEK
jgi:hypothetical protein